MMKYKFLPETQGFTPKIGEKFFTIQDFLVHKKIHQATPEGEAFLKKALKRNNVFRTFEDAHLVREGLLKVMRNFQNVWESSDSCW